MVLQPLLRKPKHPFNTLWFQAIKYQKWENKVEILQKGGKVG